MPIYFTIYADFECLNKLIDDDDKEKKTFIKVNTFPAQMDFS